MNDDMEMHEEYTENWLDKKHQNGLYQLMTQGTVLLWHDADILSNDNATVLSLGEWVIKFNGLLGTSRSI